VSTAIEPVVMDVHLPAGVAGPEPLDFDVRCFLVTHASGVVLVDTAMAGSSPLIETALTRLGVDWTAISDVVLTHHHPDHTGGLAEVTARAPQATVWAGGPDIPLIAFDGTILALTEGMRVRLLRVLDTPGHTPGHRSLIDDEASIIIAGDVVGSTGGALSRGPAAFTADPDMAEQSIRRLAELSAERMVFSHGDEVRDPFAALQRLAHARPS
jgi:glyoxylase-like metal-dependent hydrolase (beta-lactamase superfamily II)